ncbi:MAG: transketolase C-terminal domain-containing protein [Candidatus Omnitrophota bacterium]|nr:transketolase C-terminal domain-containing protein [Candidatus Omnitrophota bacterium]
MRNAYLEALHELAGKDKRILALVADNGAVVYDRYRADYPDRFFNCGISEANMVSVAAGLASCGKIPFAYTIACFITMRAFEQVRNDVCLQKMNVKLVGIGAGFVYSNLGPTHQATKDIALMRVLPGMTVFSPADPLETKKVTAAAAEIKGPVYMRLATGGTPEIYKKDYEFIAGRGVMLRDGTDVAIISTGSILYDVLQAADELKLSGISARVINIHTIKPLDRKIILEAANDTRAIMTVEEHSITGGLGSAVAEVIAEDNRVPVRFKRLGLEGVFPDGYGTYQDIKEINSLSKKDIINAAKNILKDR